MSEPRQSGRPPCDITEGKWACALVRDHSGPHRNSEGVCIGPMVACYIPPGQTMYEVIWEWLAENNPAALEMCPYKVGAVTDQGLPRLPNDPASGSVGESLFVDLRRSIELSKETAHEQRVQMPEYAEFWRGREGAFVDVLDCFEEAERGRDPENALATTELVTRLADNARLQVAYQDLLADMQRIAAGFKAEGGAEAHRVYRAAARRALKRSQSPAFDCYLHASDCAVHNEPAFPKGECNCLGCPRCGRARWVNVASRGSRWRCDGCGLEEGQTFDLSEMHYWANDDANAPRCPECRGTGKGAFEDCQVCQGRGWLVDDHRV